MLSRSELQQAGCSSGTCTAWVGLVRNSAGLFTNWLDGTPYVFYSNWNTEEPNNVGGGENCVETIRESGKWNDIACGNNRLAMCEKPQPCETGWSPFGQSCYRLDTFLGDYDAHHANCEDLGGWMVSITSAAENNFVKRKSHLNTKPRCAIQ